MAESESQKPKRRRRKAADVTDAEAAGAQEQEETAAEDEATRAASSPETTAASTSEDADELEPTPSDEAAEEAAEDVVLEAEDEVDADTDAEVQEATEAEAETAPRRPRRRRRGAGAEAAEEPAPPAKPAPTRRRPARDPSLPPPVVRAQAKYVRSSARKARLVCDHIRGKSVEEARAILAYTPRAVARDWSKLLESAVANAENNHELVGEDLFIKSVQADEGPTIKRFRPRAMGRATRIRKRTSHLTILLTPKE
jgi:ribosomal protein L22